MLQLIKVCVVVKASFKYRALCNRSFEVTKMTSLDGLQGTRSASTTSYYGV